MDKSNHLAIGASGVYKTKKPRRVSTSVIDHYGFRLNVGIIIANQAKEVFWGKRYRGSGWQFPQGGIEPYETAEEAMFRELKEETGLNANEVKIQKVTPKWYIYKLPRPLRHRRGTFCIGQRQKWFLLTLKSPDVKIDLSNLPHPEFSEWKWVNYLEPLKEVIFFKRNVYKKVLKFFEPQIVRLAVPLNMPKKLATNAITSPATVAASSAAPAATTAATSAQATTTAPEPASKPELQANHAFSDLI